MESSERDEMTRRAVLAARNSLSEGPGKPKVGVVIVKDGVVLGESFRGRTGSGDHAEYGLVKELTGQGVDLRGATVYTTLEPCSSRNHPKMPCAQHLIEAGVSEVHIGMYDPNPRIYRDGWRLLRDVGIVLKDFPEAFRNEVRADNSEFVQQFRAAAGPAGEDVCWDYKQNDGRFAIHHGHITFELQATECGADSVYFVDHAHKVGQPRHAREINEVDDPGAVDDWTHYTKAVTVGQVGMLRNELAYLVFKVTNVDNMDRGANQWRVCIAYEVRPIAYPS